MKTLFLLRHASAGNDPPGCSDHDRRLTTAGVREAEQQAEFLAVCEPAPSLLLCSSALRARETLAPIEKRLLEDGATQISRDLYLASAPELLNAINEAEDEHPSMLLLAHNPGISELANRLTSSGDEEARSRMRSGFPPAALALLRLEVASWTEARHGIAELLAFARPTDLD
jgi:phosphohistidine phosphatase